MLLLSVGMHPGKTAIKNECAQTWSKLQHDVSWEYRSDGVCFQQP